jgi:lysophospholipase L1-like esterase
VPRGTTGWRFSVRGREDRKSPVGPRPKEFSAALTTRLIAAKGHFNPAGQGVWTWTAHVPGPGTYMVSAEVMAGAQPARPAQTKNVALKDYLVVSVGDSAASGEGNPDIPGVLAGFSPDIIWWEVFIPAALLYELSREAVKYAWNRLIKNAATLARVGNVTLDMDPRPVWLEPKAHRSLRSGPALAAKALEDLDDGTVVTFLPFGRTGSTIDKGLLGPRGAEDAPFGGLGQIDEIIRTVGRRRIDALVIYIGVNDVEVSGTLETLVSHDHPLAGGGSDGDNRAAVPARGERNLAALPNKFSQLAAKLHDLNIGTIYLVEYPTGVFDDADGNPAGGCGIFSSNFDLDITRSDAALIEQLATRLNTILLEQATAHGWVYVSAIAERFSGHGYCAANSYFVGAEESLGLQGDTEGTIHPNPSGAAVIASRIAKFVRQYTLDRPRPGEVLGPVSTSKPPATTTAGTGQ